MRIGFDISQTGVNKAGCGFFAENLITHLAIHDSQNEYILYPTFGDHFWDNEYATTCQIQGPNFTSGLSHTNIHEAKQFWKSPINKVEEQLGNIDILHANNFFCPPKLENTKIIYTLYDLSFIEHPECTTEHNRIACFDGIFKASLNADLIIAISHYTREHFLKIFPHFPESRIVVVHPACRFVQTKLLERPQKYNYLFPEKFWLNVGTLEPRKNILRLLTAYAKLRKIDPNTLPLVFAGQRGWLNDDLDKLILNLGLEKHVHILGYTENDDLQWLYKNCFGFVYPSLFEGFGLPILEAMTFGAPVISSNVSSIPEVVGNAGILINPLDEVEIFEAMLKLSNDENCRTQFKNLSLDQCKLFSWDQTAKNILKIYQS